MAEEERDGSEGEGEGAEGTPGENLIGLFRSVDVSLLCLTEMILAAATSATTERLKRVREGERPIDNSPRLFDSSFKEAFQKLGSSATVAEIRQQLDIASLFAANGHAASHECSAQGQFPDFDFKSYSWHRWHLLHEHQ